MKTRLFIVRHTETIGNVEKRLTGRQDYEITERGQVLIQKLTKELEKIKFDRAYSSTSRRAIKTIEPIVEKQNLKIEESDELCEMYFGIYDGWKWEDVNKIQPEIKQTQNEINEIVGIPGQESMEETANRMYNYIFKIVKENEGKTILISSHGVAIEAFLRKIENIKFVLLSPRMMMAVILTDNGLVKETIIKFDEDISEKQVGTLSYMFNNKLKGEPISKIDRPLEKYLVDEMKYSVNLIKPIIEQMKKVVEEEKVHLEGAKQLFELPEFNSLEVAKNFVNILDEKELMADMLNTGITKDINVYIGEENEKDELKDFSIVTFKHRIGNKDLGTIGIIGPKRMDYAKVISVMKYISKKLNDNNNSNE